jgi:hypothetical protein
MAGVRTTVTIARPIDEIFAFFLAPDITAAEMDPGVESVIREPVGPAAAGPAFRFRPYALESARETVTRFTETERGRRIAFAGRFGPRRPACALPSAATEAAATVMFPGRIRPIGPLRVLSCRIDRNGQQMWAERLGRINALPENGVPSLDRTGGASS